MSRNRIPGFGKSGIERTYADRSRSGRDIETDSSDGDQRSIRVVESSDNGPAA
jgi:hypothetical protein